MRREGTFEEISDGKRYSSGDMVKAGCMDCVGCSDCCHNMEDTIQLDPYDVFRMSLATKKSFEMLLSEGYIELSVVDGIILPHVGMKGSNGACLFLDNNGRCSIHENRPGICRLFPLGRIYEDDGFSYFLQVNQCRQNNTKVKIKNFLGIDNLPEYEKYILSWHKLLKDFYQYIDGSEEKARQVSMAILKNFYSGAFDTQEDFYKQFYDRYSLFR